MVDLEVSQKKFDSECEMISCRVADVNPGYTMQCYIELPKGVNLPKGFTSINYKIEDIDRANSIVQTYWQNCWLTKDGYRYWIH